tara:strand:+ start:287 stop:514 length:228 start_codon:yes stop_codon:yes gene_type:complete
MKFICNECSKTTDIYKVKFTATTNGLVCKDAICCDEYMKQVRTEEYEGIPEIHRNEIKHSRQAIEEKFNNKMKGE